MPFWNVKQPINFSVKSGKVKRYRLAISVKFSIHERFKQRLLLYRCFDRWTKIIWKRIERDQELIDTITEQLVEFWETNVLGGIEPVIDGSEATADFLKEKYADVEENQTALPSF